MIFRSVIEKMAGDFAKHWNNKEINQLGYYLADEVVLTSPNISLMFPGKTELQGKEEVLAFWTLLNKNHYSAFEIKAIHRTGKKVTCEFKAEEQDRVMVIIYTLNEYGKSIKMEVKFK